MMSPKGMIIKWLGAVLPLSGVVFSLSVDA